VNRGRDYYRSLSDAMERLGAPRYCEVLYDQQAKELRSPKGKKSVRRPARRKARRDRRRARRRSRRQPDQ